ncbi:hypothetical protein GCM10009593_18140 [Microlunatus antarcticus]
MARAWVLAEDAGGRAEGSAWAATTGWRGASRAAPRTTAASGRLIRDEKERIEKERVEKDGDDKTMGELLGLGWRGGSDQPKMCGELSLTQHPSQ